MEFIIEVNVEFNVCVLVPINSIQFRITRLNSDSTDLIRIRPIHFFESIDWITIEKFTSDLPIESNGTRSFQTNSIGFQSTPIHSIGFQSVYAECIILILSDSALLWRLSKFDSHFTCVDITRADCYILIILSECNLALKLSIILLWLDSWSDSNWTPRPITKNGNPKNSRFALKFSVFW